VVEYVLDASALLALLNGEEGAELVEELLPQSVISAVNLAEVVTRLVAVGMPKKEIHEILSLLGLKIASFEEEEAFQTGFMYASTGRFGLSLGDRACLALAKVRNARAVTADRVWKQIGGEVEVELIR